MCTFKNLKKKFGKTCGNPVIKTSRIPIKNLTLEATKKTTKNIW